ncbi:MAG TPA: MMPL family transporter [Candidatus Dormibacteraeota bacterium]|nr:MMPL family transporter [Candidatus Dormibacteraeota bacterium]
MFAAWGRFVYRNRWAVLVASGAFLAISIVSLAMGGTLQSGGPLSSNLESAKAQSVINAQLNTANTKPTSSFDLIFKSDTMTVSDSAYQAAVNDALAPIQGDTRIDKLTTPYSTGNPQAQAALTSKDGHEALVIVELNSTGRQSWSDYSDLRGKVHSSTLHVTGTGFVPINQAFNTTLETDLQRAEFISLPVTLVLLVLIFAGLVAAGLPLGVGLLTIAGGIGGTFFLNRFTDVSQYALNIVTLIGLGVSIDYSLFIVNRFRDELAKGASREEAVSTTIATAGRAITFSGLTVAVGLSALLFFQGTFMASMGAAGAIVVAVAVVYGLTFLPALLSVIGTGVNRLRLPLGSGLAGGRGFWHTLATWVMKRPVIVLVPTVAFLVLASLPFFSLRLANGNVDMLPQRLEARQGYDRLIADFPGQGETTYNIVVSYPSGSPLTTSRITDQYALDKRIAQIPGVNKVTSIYDLSSNLSLYDYEQLYTGNPSNIPAAARPLIASTVGKNMVLIQASSSADPSSDTARNILKAIRADQGVGGGQVLVGGETAVDVDVIKFIYDQVPLAVASVVIATYVLLFLLTGSVVLPLKAVILNFLSIGASFGALVFIFQQGHFSNILGFTAQSLDPSIPVILFSIVFGLSMDYEVLLVSRMHEEYVRLGNNTAAVASGLERTGRLITGAAAIMFVVFMSFGLAEVVIIKAIGIGLAIAVAIDATIVRSLVVPAVMRLLGDVNWWAPRPLRWLYDRIGIGDLGYERSPQPEPELDPVKRSEEVAV